MGFLPDNYRKKKTEIQQLKEEFTELVATWRAELGNPDDFRISELSYGKKSKENYTKMNALLVKRIGEGAVRYYEKCQ